MIEDLETKVENATKELEKLQKQLSDKNEKAQNKFRKYFTEHEYQFKPGRDLEEYTIVPYGSHGLSGLAGIPYELLVLHSQTLYENNPDAKVVVIDHRENTRIFRPIKEVAENLGINVGAKQ